MKPCVATTEEDINNFCKELPRLQANLEKLFLWMYPEPTGKIEKPTRHMYNSENLVDAQNRA